MLPWLSLDIPTTKPTLTSVDRLVHTMHMEGIIQIYDSPSHQPAPATIISDVDGHTSRLVVNYQLVNQAISPSISLVEYDQVAFDS